MVFGADGGTLWTHARDHVVRRWDLGTGQGAAWPGGALVRALAFSPVRTQALTIEGDGHHLQLRYLASGRPKVPALVEPLAWVVAAGFRADGTWVVVGCSAGARLYDLATSRPLGPPLPFDGGLGVAALHPGGRWLALGGADATRLWRVPAPLEGKPRDVRRWAEQITGLRLDDQRSSHAAGGE
jgi:hypothetical protein